MIAYHGCDAETAERLLRGEPFRKSQNDYDWLGEGIYFWEFGADRAFKFASDQKRRGKVATPAVVGALIQLGRCFDLMDTHFTEELPVAFEMCKDVLDRAGQPLPANAGNTPDHLLRRRDCAVLNYLPEPARAAAGLLRYGPLRVRRGSPGLEGSGIRHQSHVQIAVRNPGCVVGVFRPTMTS